MTKSVTLYIRGEINNNEHRTPIVPTDIPALLNRGFIIYLEGSNNRIYKNEEYITEGATLTNVKWYHPLFKDAYIVGIKKLNEIDKLANHKHIYFSHSYKNQADSKEILNAFSKSKSLLYDFEFFLDEKNERLISFGFYAGIVGCLLGLLQYLEKKVNNRNLTNLSSHSFEIENVKDSIRNNIHLLKTLKISIVGTGRCGQGASSALHSLGLHSEYFAREDEKSTLKEYDIVYNCITLDDDSKDIWFSKQTEFSKPIIIVDISCDCAKVNNPIAIYSQETSWKTPVFSYNKFVDIIAISNLPSLVPKDSSDYFSKKFVDLLLDMKGDTWHKNENIFREKILDFNKSDSVY